MAIPVRGPLYRGNRMLRLAFVAGRRDRPRTRCLRRRRKAGRERLQIEVVDVEVQGVVSNHQPLPFTAGEFGASVELTQHVAIRPDSAVRPAGIAESVWSMLA